MVVKPVSISRKFQNFSQQNIQHVWLSLEFKTHKKCVQSFCDYLTVNIPKRLATWLASNSFFYKILKFISQGQEISLWQLVEKYFNEQVVSIVVVWKFWMILTTALNFIAVVIRRVITEPTVTRQVITQPTITRKVITGPTVYY